MEARDLEVGRVTRSGRVYDRPVPQQAQQVDVLNPRVQAEMRRLGTTFYNPVPETILNQDLPNAPLGREVGANLELNEVRENGENGLSAMDHLFGDFAFHVRENDMDEVVMFEGRGGDEIREKLKKMHVLDALDMLVDNNTNIPADLRDELLREIVLELKSNLPKSYKEAWDHPDPKMRDRWRKAFGKEKDSMLKRKVWKAIKKSTMPKGRRCVKSKWVFDIKRNGTFKVRLVACGYTQIPGVDFTDSYAPVISDVSWRILIVLMIVWSLDGMIIDVETAFLLGDLEEEIYMICREVHEDDEVLLLQHSIYGLVQAARQYYKKFISVLKKIGF